MLQKFNSNTISFLENPSDLRKSPSDYFADKRFSEKKIENIIILKSASYSKNFLDLKFTNFLSSENCKECNVLKRLFEIWNKDKMSVYSEFFAVEIRTNNNKPQRLCRILSKNRNKRCIVNCRDYRNCLTARIEDTIEHKYKNSEEDNVPLRVFARRVGKIVYVLLIDLYHLGLTTQHHKTKIDSIHNYEKENENKYCFSNIWK